MCCLVAEGRLRYVRVRRRVRAGARPRAAAARLADLDGDQPPMLGLAADPATGLRDWLRSASRRRPTRSTGWPSTVAPGLTLLPAGPPALAAVAPEAGAALGVALRERPDRRRSSTSACRRHPARRGVARGGRRERRRAARLLPRAAPRGAHARSTAGATGAVLVEEPGRALGRREVADVLGVPVLATVPVRSSIARVVDAGVFAGPAARGVRASPAREVLARIGVLGPGRARRVTLPRAPVDHALRDRCTAAARPSPFDPREVGSRRAARAPRARAARRSAAVPARATPTRVARRARRRRRRARPARALARRSRRHRDHGERARPGVRRAARVGSSAIELDARRRADRAARRAGRRAARAAARPRVADGRRPPPRRLAAARGAPAARARRTVPHDPALRRPRRSRSTRSALDDAAGAFLDGDGARRVEPGRRRRRRARARRRCCNALARAIDAGERIVTIEETAELRLAAAARRAARGAAGQRRRRRRGVACASSCAPRCACGPTGSSSARCAAARRSTCCRR